MTQALKQYIELARQEWDSLTNASPAPLNALRRKALEALESTPLPRRGSEGYETTDLETMLSPDFGVNTRRVPLWKALEGSNGCAVSPFGLVSRTVVGDTAKPEPAAAAARPVIVETFAEAWRSHPEVMEEYLGKVAPMSNPIVALNTLLAQDGLLIFIPRGTEVENTVQVVNYLARTPQPVMSVRRLLIVAESGAQARVLCCDHTHTSDLAMSLQVAEVFVGDGARLDIYDMEETHASAQRLSTLYARQQRGSSLLLDGITLQNGSSRNEWQIDIDEPDCDTQLLGMAIATQSQHIDNHTLINHNAPRCRSNEMMKYLLDDAATGAFAGKILVGHGCDGVEAYQGNRNICASPSARMFTKPQLEIYTDDVKCSHGATVGQLDQEALFYMLTRGVGRDMARTLLMQAFMADVIDGVRLPLLRDRLHALVERRLAGQPTKCDACAATAAQCAKGEIASNRPAVD